MLEIFVICLVVLVILDLIVSVFLGIFLVNLRDRLGETFIDLFTFIEEKNIMKTVDKKTWDEKMMEIEIAEEKLRKNEESGLKDL
jgi:hypothetical protein